MPDKTEAEKAYAAGYFEGRGYIRIGCQKGRRPRLTVLLRANDSRLRWFIDRWGGAPSYVRSQYTKKTYMQGGVNWSLTRICARDFLQDILPYIISDNRRLFAAKAVEFITRVVDNNEKVTPELMELVKDIRDTGRLRESLDKP